MFGGPCTDLRALTRHKHSCGLCSRSLAHTISVDQKNLRDDARLSKLYLFHLHKSRFCSINTVNINGTQDTMSATDQTTGASGGGDENREGGRKRRKGPHGNRVPSTGQQDDSAEEKCDNCNNAGPTRRAFDGPNGTKICTTCNSHNQASSASGPNALPRCDDCGRHGKTARSYKGPDDKRVCQTCFRKNMKAAVPNTVPNAVADTSLPTCDNCGKHGKTARDYKGPEGKRVCNSCFRNPGPKAVVDTSLPRCDGCGKHTKQGRAYIGPNPGERICRSCQIKIPIVADTSLPRCDNSVPDPYATLMLEKEKEVDETVTTQLYIEWLLQNDAEEGRATWEEIDEAAMKEIQRLLAADITILFGTSSPLYQAFLASLKTAQPASTFPTTVDHMATTLNGGIHGDPAVLSALDQTIWNGRFPTFTPSDGLLCGPNALALTLNSLRLRGVQNDPTTWGDTRPFTPDDIMRTLFQNYNSHDTADYGTPTAEYNAYLDEAFSFWQQRNELLTLRDLDALQLRAALTLLYRSGALPVHFQLGVVASAYLRTTEAGDIVPQSARAEVVGDWNGTDAVAWVHNNIAFGHGEYSHWEGFNEDGRSNTVAGWGFHTRDSGEYSRQICTNASYDHQTLEQRKQREEYNQYHREKRQKKKRQFMCLPFRSKNSMRCDGAPGASCKQCGDDGDCTWQPTGKEPILAKTLAQWTTDDIAE